MGMYSRSASLFVVDRKQIEEVKSETGKSLPVSMKDLFTSADKEFQMSAHD